MDEANEGPEKRGKSVSLQFILAFLSNFSNIAPGMAIGFSAVVIPALTHLDSQQISWFASIISLATPLGALCSGPIADKFGRKVAMSVVNSVSFIGWITISLAYYLTSHQYEVLLTGRFFTGLAVGLCGTPAAVYVAEISSPELRSVFTTWVSVFYAVGILVVYVLGLILKDNWGTIALIAASFSVLSMLFLKVFIPESPLWLISKQRMDEAKKNMCKLYRTKDYDDEVRFEIENLLNNGSFKTEKTKKNIYQQMIKKVKMLMKKNFLKPYCLVVTFFFFQQFSGIFVIVFYAIDIVKEAKVELDPYITIVLIASVRMVAVAMLSFFSRHFGRRPLCLVSGIGITISMVALGSYTLAIKDGLINKELEKSLSMVPLGLLMLYFFISTMGFYPIPFAISSEVYPRNIRGTAAGIGVASNYIFNFITVKLYPSMRDIFGSHSVFYFFGVVGLLGTFFVLLFLPETRGKTLEEIQQHFVSKKKNVENEDEKV